MCSFRPAGPFLQLRAPWIGRRSAEGQEAKALSAVADQPLPRALTALATVATVVLLDQVTEVSVVTVPLATRMRVNPMSVTCTVARWLDELVLLRVSTVVGLVA